MREEVVKLVAEPGENKYLNKSKKNLIWFYTLKDMTTGKYELLNENKLL